MEPTPAEQHLGDRLAALVDGELGHETRERVLAHLATCHTCKAEADAQRKLKSVFADAAPPPPSEGLLARLQGLPGGLDGGGPPAPSASASSSPWDFEYLPAGGVLASDRGFRVHRVQEVDRSSSRGRRFAFVAAGAVSLAAFAIGGALTSAATGDSTVAASGDGGTNTRSPRTAAVGAERGGGRQEEREERGMGPAGTPSGPVVAPVQPPVLSASPLDATLTTRHHGLTVVPVIDVLPTLHPPLIHPTQYRPPSGEGLPEQHESVRQPLIAATPMAVAPPAAATAPVGATPAPTLPP
ncbi:zf-HC2 domain-containing protein, partial [Streptomyces sp. CNQ085]|nr:zf-HC2 domain-containing protein [Streptomyces sp. CNQ085]